MPRRCDYGVPRNRRLRWWSLVSMFALMPINPAPAAAQEPIGIARVIVNNVTGTFPGRQSVRLSEGKEVFQSEVIGTQVSSSSLLRFRGASELAICPATTVDLKAIKLSTSEIFLFIPIG